MLLRTHFGNRNHKGVNPEGYEKEDVRLRTKSTEGKVNKQEGWLTLHMILTGDDGRQGDTG